MKPILNLLLAAAILLPLGGAAQTIPPGAKESARDRAVKRCKENRGTDCESREGLREWLREERPITDAERTAAAAGRRHREKCQKNPKADGC